VTHGQATGCGPTCPTYGDTCYCPTYGCPPTNYGCW
jgi:hypothetical protein